VVPGDSGGPLAFQDSRLLVLPERSRSASGGDGRAAAIADRQDARRVGGTDEAIHRNGEISDGGEVTEESGDTTVDQPGHPKSLRFFGSTAVDPEQCNRDFAKVGREILQYFAATVRTELGVTIEIRAKNGILARHSPYLSENAATLKFSQFGFEED